MGRTGSYRHHLVPRRQRPGPPGPRWATGLEFAPMKMMFAGFGGVTYWRSTVTDDHGRYAWRVAPKGVEL